MGNPTFPQMERKSSSENDKKEEGGKLALFPWMHKKDAPHPGKENTANKKLTSLITDKRIRIQFRDRSFRARTSNWKSGWLNLLDPKS